MPTRGSAVSTSSTWSAPARSCPFADAAFDLVSCCDVLEHVRDLDRVIAETARVLRPGGLYLFDTINRTRRSKVLAIKAMQEWRTDAHHGHGDPRVVDVHPAR